MMSNDFYRITTSILFKQKSYDFSIKNINKEAINDIIQIIAINYPSSLHNGVIYCVSGHISFKHPLNLRAKQFIF